MLSKNRFLLIWATTTIAGLLGGALSGRIFAPEPAFAQARPSTQRKLGQVRPTVQRNLAQFRPTVEARSFRLVDSRGVTRATFFMHANEQALNLKLVDHRGKTRVWFLVGNDGQPVLNFYAEDLNKNVINLIDKNGKVVALGAGRASGKRGSVGKVKQVRRPDEKRDATVVSPADMDAAWAQMQNILDTVDELRKLHR